MNIVRNFFFISILFAITINAKSPKIVGLVATHNEAGFIKHCLQAMAQYTDAIVVLDDVSVDETVHIIESVAKECKVEKIIKKQIWVRDEKGDKNLLLKAGREIGGTHFIMLDADEMFVATCKKNNWLRNQILSLKKGQIMCFPMMNVWNGLEKYRDDELMSPTHPKWRGICAVLCDDGQCSYEENQVWGPSGALHVTRIPANRICEDEVKNIVIKDINHGLLHYKFVNLEEVAIKKIWYMCVEFMNATRQNSSYEERVASAKKINEFYKNEFKTSLEEGIKIKLSKVPQEWYKYAFFNPLQYQDLHEFRKNEITGWLRTLGKKYFEPLNIWKVDWVKAVFEK